MKFLLALLACFGTVMPVQAETLELAVPVDASMSELHVSVQAAAVVGPNIDPAYLAIAEATGGQVLSLDPATMGSSAGEQALTQLMAGTQGAESILTLQHKFESTTTPLAAALLRPDGSVVKVGDAGVVTNQTQSGQLWTVTALIPGLWKVHVTGSGSVSVRALAKTPVFFLSARYVQPGGRPGHDGLFPADDQNPAQGSPQLVELSLGSEASLQDIRFVLQDAAGQQLAALDRLHPHSADQSEFIAEMNVPATPYRFVLLAQDGQGYAVQRTYPPLFQPPQVRGEMPQ